MQITESVRMALSSIRGNKLRTGLTLLSMSIGVFAIVGVAAAVAALSGKVDQQLESFGRNSFIIQKNPALQMGHSDRRTRNRKDITLRQGMELKRRLTIAPHVGMSNFTPGVVVKYDDKSTDPEMIVVGGDEAYIINGDFTIDEGRSLDPADVQSASDVAVIGAGIIDKLFKGTSAIGKTIKLNGHPYIVIGTLKAKGAVFGNSQDNLALIPITSSAKYFFDEWGTSITLYVRAESIDRLQETIDQSVGLLRIIRRVGLGEENDFEVITNESLTETFGDLTKYINYFGYACGGIALLAAGIGIMNIMLVSVKERTREIGIRKAVGATSTNILTQFIIEAVTLCQFGALIGIGLGLLGGVGISALIDVKPQIPWMLVLFAIGVCLLIGVVFGSYPAWKASRLDPIDALRYE